MVKYDKVTKSFSRFFDSDILQAVLDSKVDVKEFKKVSESKVSNEKMEVNMQKVEKLHEQLTNVAMMLVETSKSMLPK